MCVFLRSLEYYEGILFLTTNRVKTIDEAIASRIHLPLRYADLSQSAQKEVWQSFLKKAKATKGASSLAPKDVERLAKEGLNGRQVRDQHSHKAALTKPSSRSKMPCRWRKLWRMMKRVQSGCHTSRRPSISTSSSNRTFVEPAKLRACTHILKWIQWLIDPLV